MKLAAWITCLALVPAAGAANAPPTRWVMQESEGNCALRHVLKDSAGQNAAQVEITWDRDYGDEGAVKVYGRTPPGGTMHLLQDHTQNRWSKPVNGLGPIVKGAGLLNVMNPLRDGVPLTVVLEYPGKPPMRYVTSTTGVAEAVAEFNRCKIAQKKPDEPPPRWTVQVQTNSCGFGQGGFGGTRGLYARFTSMAGGVNFYVNADEREFAKGGVLRMELPGRKDPWLVDSEKRFSTADPVAAEFLAAMRAGRPVPASFVPRNAAPLPLKVSLDGFGEATAMYDACVASRARLPGGKSEAFIDLRYAVDESSKGCEITGVYQIDGVAIWLALATDGAKHVLKLTQRRTKPGQVVAKLDMGAFGAPSDTDSTDATLDLNAVAFSAMRRDLKGVGREFHARVGRGTRYSYRFGGANGSVEAAMFDACVRAKYPALK